MGTFVGSTSSLVVAFLAAFAFAICSLRAAEDFLKVAAGAGSFVSTVVAVDVGEGPDWTVSSPEVVDDLCEISDVLRETLEGVAPTFWWSGARAGGFLNNPLSDGRCLGGLKGIVFAIGLFSFDWTCCFSGLGVLEGSGSLLIDALGSVFEAGAGILPWVGGRIAFP